MPGRESEVGRKGSGAGQGVIGRVKESKSIRDWEDDEREWGKG